MYIIDNLSYSDLKVGHRLESNDATIEFALVALVNVGAEDLFLKWRAAIFVGPRSYFGRCSRPRAVTQEGCNPPAI